MPSKFLGRASSVQSLGFRLPLHGSFRAEGSGFRRVFRHPTTKVQKDTYNNCRCCIEGPNAIVAAPQPFQSSGAQMFIDCAFLWIACSPRCFRVDTLCVYIHKFVYAMHLKEFVLAT